MSLKRSSKVEGNDKCEYSSPNWEKIKQSIATASTEYVVRQMLDNISDVDPNVVVVFGERLLKDGWGSSLKAQSSKTIFHSTPTGGPSGGTTERSRVRIKSVFLLKLKSGN